MSGFSLGVAPVDGLRPPCCHQLRMGCELLAGARLTRTRVLEAQIGEVGTGSGLVWGPVKD
jgi:hypothetical protein